MVQYALYGFIAAMVAGGFLTTRVIKRERISLGMGLGHAVIGLAAIGLLAIQVFRGPRVMLLNDALLLFSFTATVGVLLLVFRIDKQPPPLLVVALHALFAVVGLGLLISGAFHF